MTKTLVYALLALGAITLLYCNRTASTSVDIQQYASLQDSVAYVGMATCRSCHADVYDTFIETGMGQSFDLASPEKTAATYGDHAIVYDKTNDYYYQPFFRDSILYIMEYRLSGRDTIHKRLEKVSYIIGSGHHTNSHIIDINGYLFQVPITYYTQEERWDLAPGYERDNLRFSRILTTECLTCHNHYPEAVEGSMNKYASMPAGIECERCHGPGEVHVREKLAGVVVDTSKYIDYSIVNPRDLPKSQQMDLCQRCHLQGLAVLEPGKTFYDFKPGMHLSDVFNVFLPRYTNSHEQFIMASQADRLRMSKCYTLSENMTCLTCHHPHHSVRQTDKLHFNKTCMNCHQQEALSDCSLSAEARAVEQNSCIGCHMPPSGSMDIPHVNITDHFISKTTTKGSTRITQEEKEAIAQFLGLEMLTKEEPTSLDMARGYLAMHDKFIAVDAILDSAFHYLSRVDRSDPLFFETSVHYYFARGNYRELVAWSTRKPAALLDNAWTAYRIGEAIAATGDHAKALLYYKKATQLMPLNLDFQEKLGTTYVSLQYLPQARKVFNFILAENPDREVALCNLGYTMALQGQLTEAERLYDKALLLDPDYEQALINKAALRLYLKDDRIARKLLQRVVTLNPDNQDAKKLLQ